MPNSLSRAQPSASSPIRVLLVVLAVVFTVETAIMFAIERCPWLADHNQALAFLDALTLSVIISPVLWVLIVRPLRLAMFERGQFVGRLLQAQEEERARLARDLHDDLGQLLTAVLLRLRAVDQAPDLPSARGHAADAAAIVSETVDSVRQLARGLGPPALADLGLSAVLARFCEDLAASSGLDVHHRFTIAPSARFAPQAEITIYRIAQEACTNILRHARAARVDISLELSGGSLRLAVSDDGRGFTPGELSPGGTSRGLGLQGMRERVLALGGELSINSNPELGTTITASIPVASA